MNIEGIMDNVELVKLCNDGFKIFYELPKYISITKEDNEINKRFSPIVLVYSNALIFLKSAFDDALEGKYPSSVNNLRGSFETHLVMEKLNISTDEEFKIWTEHKDPKNKKTYNAYRNIFGPGVIMKVLPSEIEDKFKLVYGRMSQYSHSGINGITDNILKGENNIIAFTPYYQKDLTNRQLKDVLVMLWLNGTTISGIFSNRIPDEIKQKIEKWGDELESIGTFSKEWIRLTLFTNENLQEIIKNKIKSVIDGLSKDGKVYTFYLFQYPQEEKICITIQGNVRDIQNNLEDMLKSIEYDNEKTNFEVPFDAENDQGEIDKFGSKENWDIVRNLFGLGSEMAFRFMEKFDGKIDPQNQCTAIHIFLQNIGYTYLEESDICKEVILNSICSLSSVNNKEFIDEIADDLCNKIKASATTSISSVKNNNT